MGKPHRFFLCLIVLMVSIALGCNLTAPASSSEPDPSMPAAAENPVNNEPDPVENYPTSGNQLGFTRANPYPPGTKVSLPGWEVQVLEFLRGEAALQVINTEQWQANPAPAGSEYVLAKVFLRCTSFDDQAHSLGISEMSITGSSFALYGDRLDGKPAPEFLYEDMYTAEVVEGWVDAILPVNEENPILVVNLLRNEPEKQALRFFALEEGAAITLPAALAELPPNELGVENDNPVPFGQAAISADWQVTVLESIRGAQAAAILQPEEALDPALEYLLVKLKLTYRSSTDLPTGVNIGFYGDFHIFDPSTGNRFEQLRSTRPPKPSDRNWLGGAYLPGAEMEGWVPLTISAGDPAPILEVYLRGSEPTQRYFWVNP